MRPDLECEFDRALDNLGPEHVRQLAAAGIDYRGVLDPTAMIGVDLVVLHGATFTPASSGDGMFILGCWSADWSLLDTLAFRPESPGEWWSRTGEPGVILGEGHYVAAVRGESPARPFASLVHWLRGGCVGFCVLDDARWRWSTKRAAEDDAALRAELLEVA